MLELSTNYTQKYPRFIGGYQQEKKPKLFEVEWDIMKILTGPTTTTTNNLYRIN